MREWKREPWTANALYGKLILCTRKIAWYMKTAEGMGFFFENAKNFLQLTTGARNSSRHSLSSFLRVNSSSKCFSLHNRVRVLGSTLRLTAASQRLEKLSLLRIWKSSKWTRKGKLARRFTSMLILIKMQREKCTKLFSRSSRSFPARYANSLQTFKLFRVFRE